MDPLTLLLGGLTALSSVVAFIFRLLLGAQKTQLEIQRKLYEDQIRQMEAVNNRTYADLEKLLPAIEKNTDTVQELVIELRDRREPVVEMARRWLEQQQRRRT